MYGSLADVGFFVMPASCTYRVIELLCFLFLLSLCQCDVFSLGITLYEIISGRPLPPNGEEWHSLRSGKVGMPMGMPEDLSQTLHAMMHVSVCCACVAVRFLGVCSVFVGIICIMVLQFEYSRSQSD